VVLDRFFVAKNKNEMRVTQKSNKETNISSSIWYVRYFTLVAIYHRSIGVIHDDPLIKVKNDYVLFFCSKKLTMFYKQNGRFSRRSFLSIFGQIFFIKCSIIIF